MQRKIKLFSIHLPASLLILLSTVFLCAGAVGASEMSDVHSLQQIDVELNKSVIKRTVIPVQRVSVANPSIVDYHLITPQQILLVPKNQTGVTNLIVWYDENWTEIFDVRVFDPEQSEEAIRSMLKKIAPDTGIEFNCIGPDHKRQIILYGDVDSQKVLDRVLTLMQMYVSSPNQIVNLTTLKGLQQVQIEIKIAEISRSGIKQMGMGFLLNKDWSIGLFSSGSFSASAETSRSIERGGDPGFKTTGIYNESTGEYSYLTVPTDGSENIASQGISSSISIESPFSSAFQLALHAVQGDVVSTLSILKGQNLARILAKPTLVAMSGQEAEFLVGGEFPIPVSGERGSTNIEFRQYGVMVRFQPMVLGNEEILLHVEPEVSSPDYGLAVFSGGVSVPGLKTRRGSTTLHLKDGQSFAMAGLLKEDVYTAVAKIPFIGDIPYLGTLFTSKQYEKDESELVIIVTPRIVRALNPEEVGPLPGEGMGDDSDDFDFFIRNRFKKSPPATPPEITGEETGPTFIGGMGYSR